MNESHIEDIRRFNRFHTRLIGALDEHILASGFSLVQSRVLYEIATAPASDARSAREIGEQLRLDAGYLSRVLTGLETAGLVLRTPTADNARRLALTLTAQGRAAFSKLDAASACDVEVLLAPLSMSERRELVGAMVRIRRLLGDGPDDRTFVLRDPEPGDLGWVIHRQARLYADEYGWDASFETLLTDIVHQFARDFDPARERCWIADRDGEVVGSAFVVSKDDRTAKLRMLYVEKSARGLGLGRRLVEECVRFATARGYAHMELWTNDVLHAARRIYEATGFTMARAEPHRSFGHDLVGEIWERDL